LAHALIQVSVREHSIRAIEERLRKMEDDDMVETSEVNAHAPPADVGQERVMKFIPPALWSTPPGLSDNGNAVFAALTNALKWASEIIRHTWLARFSENDFYPYHRRMNADLSLLWAIADRHKHVPAETWDCAWAIRQAIWPVSNALSDLFMDANFPWTGTEPLPNLEFTRERLIELRKSFAEEPLMLDLCKAVAKEFSLSVESTSSQPKPRLTFDQSTWSITMDGLSFENLKPKAFLIYKAVSENPNITRQKLRSTIRGIKGDKTIPNALATLPDDLKQTVESDNSGYWIRLPTRTRKKSAKSGK
jgi:hypothetical protein